MEIRDAKGNILIDSVVTQNAEHVEELMQTDHVSLQWVSNAKSVLPAGSYVVPFNDGVRYILLDPYTPDQNNTDEFTYSPQFKHPKMYLGRVPYTRATTDEDGNAATLLVWDYKGYLSNLLADICSFAGAALKNAGLITTETLSYSILGDITGNVSLSISNNDVLSVLNALASNLNCEWHIDWEQMRLYFGNVSFDKNEGSRLVLTSGGNVGMASVSSQKDTYYNVYRPQGSARNMAGVSDSGSYYATNRRLELDKDAFPDGLIYTDGKGKVISKASFEQTKLPMLAQTLFFDEIYPKLNLYAYDIRYRERYLLDDNGDKVETYAGSGKYKRYAIWYMRLAFPVRNSDGSVSSWKDAVLGDTFRLIDGYTLMCAFGANPSSSLTSPLAGREFELRYVETEADAKSLSAEADEKSGDTGVTVKAGDFEIIYNTEGNLIIPTTPSQGLVPKGEATPSENGNIITLYNIVLGSDFLKAAQTDLANAAKREIARQFSDLNQYTFSSDPVSFKDDMPGLYIGRSVTYKDGVGNTLDTRIMRLTTKLDYPFMVEITVGNKVLKGTTSQLKEDVELILSGNRQAASAGGVTESVVRSLIRGYCNNTYLSKKSDDVAKGVITLLKGSYWGKFNEESGAAMTINPENGQSFLEVDRLKVRLKAFFEQLEIQKVSYVGGKLVLSKGQGVTIVDVEEVTNLNGAAYRCYFLGEQEGVKIDNKLAVGDQMICKDFNISEGETDGATNKYYWRLVTAVSSETVKRGNNVCHWVDLSVSDCDTGSDVPSVGDTICHLGNRSDTDRQGAEILSVVDVNSPSFSIYAGIDGYTLTDKEYVTMGVAGGKAYFKVYGDMYVGDRATGDAEPNSYLRWQMGDKGKKGKLTIKGEISIKSTLSGYKDAEGEAVEITLEDKLKQTNDNVMKIIEGFRNQIDGAIETWFFDKDEPELTDEPAVKWKADDDETEENKDKDKYSVHVGDLYYSKNGKAYRFTKDGDTYLWKVIQDNDIVKALEEAKKANDAANAAQGTANSKMKVFVVQPTDEDEYNVGDMWVDATYPADGSTYKNEILHCVLGKAAGEPFDISHWNLSMNIKQQFDQFAEGFNKKIEGFTEQLDGKIDTWYYPYEPTIGNAPADGWDSDDKEKHSGDLFYDTSKGVAYRWTGTEWETLKDKEIQTALDKAKDAQDTADNKRRVFLTTPTVPYDEGDLWVVKGEGGNTTKVCVKGNTEAFDAADWEDSNDSVVTDFTKILTESLQGIKDQIDKKAETWYQADDPSNAEGWVNSEHKGDLWYNTTNDTTWYYNGTEWVQQNVPTDVFDKIDGKAAIYVAKPLNGYNERDLWFLEADYTLSGTAYKKGTIVIATASSGTWDASHWKKFDRYTDEATIQEFIDNTLSVFSEDIKKQIDKKAETWYQDADPSEAWTTEDLKKEHVGDLWYDTTNGETKCYVKNADGTYGWKKQDVPKEVFDRIDGKAAIYVKKPDTYHVKDLWFLEADYTLNGVTYKKGTILVANATSNLFSEEHWDKLDRYTDDSSLTDFINGDYKDFVNNIRSQVDKKAETWYQEADPSTSWNEIEKAQHVGDLWWKPSDNLTYCYYLDTDKNTYGWKRQDVPQEVFDRIDGKAEIFVAKPASGYHERDMWILEADYTFTVSGVSTKYKAGTIVIATATWAGPWQDSPCNTHWKKFDSYTDSESFNQLSEKVEEVKTHVGEFDNSIKGLKNELTEAFKDGILDGTERKSIKDCLKNAERECADVIFAYDSLVNNNDAYNTLDAADTKASFVAAYQKLLGNSRVVVNEGVRVATFDMTKGSYGELVSYIKGLLDKGDDYLLTPSDIVNVNTKISNYTESYKTFSANLNAIRNLIDMSVAGSLSSLSASLGSYAYLKEALKGETSIQGGLVLSNVIALGDKTGDKFTIQSGVSGIVESDNGGGIAFWAGGSRIDKTLEPTNENAAKFLVRHDGTGYAAGGKFWWDDDGKIHADPTSFLVGENNIKNILGLFEPLYDLSGSTEWENIVGVKPLFMFDHLDVAGTGISIGSNKIYKNASGVIVIEGDLAVTGGITMFSSSGIVSGIKEQMLGVLDPSQFGERNGYISIIGEIGGGTVKGIKVNGQTYNTIDSKGLVTIPDYPTSLDWAKIENKPTTLIQYGITDAKISDGVITLGNNTITPLTAHQSIYALTIIGIGENTFSYTPNSAAAVLALTPAWIGAPATDGTGASGTWGISVSGNAATANKLKNAVSVWGQSFDGSADITGNMKNVGSITPTGETLKIVGNLIVTGGITMYATDGTFDSAFGQQLANFVDNVTIKFVNDKLVAVNNGNVTSIIISGTEYKPTDGAVTLPDLFAPSAHKHAIADVNGLQDILNKKLDTSLKGTANGLATLDASGKVPSAQLPSYVDDVLEYTDKASFPTTGESGKIYIDQTTNLTYRWGGTVYVEISQSLALGETSSTAYAGDKGKQNATDIAALKTGKADKATTLAGYGITNAYTKDETDGKYLALAGGTMTGVISSTFASNTWINGVTNAIIKASYTGYGSVLSMPVYGGRVSISSYPGSENDNHIYFTYATAEQIAAGDNSVPMVRMSWDAATNTLAAAVFQGSLIGNASSATKLLNARTLWGQNFDGTANVSGDMSGVGTITPKSGTDLKIVGNLVVTGGITMYATEGIVSNIMEQILVDGTTIGKDANGRLYAINTGNVKGVTVNGTTYKPNETTGIITIPNYPTSLDWSKIENKPSSFTPSSHTHTFASLTDKPTTISGYGITDAKIANGVITLGTATITPLTTHQTVTLASGTDNGTLKLTVNGTATDNIAVKGLGSAAYTEASAYAAASHTHSQYLVAASLDGYVNALTNNTSTNVFVTAISKSGKTISYTKSFTKKSLSAAGHSGWTSAAADALIIPDMSFIAYWNGAYNSSGSSNLTYCAKGAFGDMATASKSSYYTKTEVNTKLTDGSVTKVGTTNVGATNIPIYLKAGVPTAVTLVDTANNLINNLTTGTSTPEDADYYVAQYVGGGTTTTTFHRRPHSALYAYIKGKAEGTWAISVSGNAATATTLQTARTLWGQSFNGSANISGNMSGVGQITFSALSGTNGRALLYQQMADNDYFRIYVGGTASDAGFAEIATADNGNEPIYVRQYSDAFTKVTRTLTLLDASGNTTVPGTLTMANGKSNGTMSVSGNTSVGSLTVGGINVTKSSTGILKIDGDLIVTGGITMYATDGTASNLMEQILVDGVTISKKADGTLYALNTGNVRSIIMGSTTYTPNSSGAITLPSSFAPLSHTHVISEITNLQATLDGKSAVGHTHSYLPLSGGIMKGNITLASIGDAYIGKGEYDGASGVGGALNNLVIGSWWGVSFTTSCGGQTYTGTNAVSIDCRNGYVYANTFVGAFSGNASTASKWATARTLTLSGSVTGSVSLDGSGNVTLTTTTNHTHNYAGSSSAGGAATSSISSNCLNYTGSGKGVLTAYQTASAFMGSDASWASYIICNHGDGSSYYNQTIRMPFDGVPQYQRLENGTYSGWKTFITSENIGSQSVNYATSSSSVRSESGNKIYCLQYYSGNGTFTVNGTDVGGEWSIPSDSSGAQFGNGQAIRMWFSPTYYTDILSTPNSWGSMRGLYIRQITDNAIPAGTFTGGWRLLLDSFNYNRYVPSLTGTGASGTWGISISGNAASATQLATARSIFGKSFNGTADIGGQGLFYGTYTSEPSARYAYSGLQIRENGLVKDSKSDIGYAPSIGFHWSNMRAGIMLYHLNGNFYFLKDGTSRASLDANLIGNAATATNADLVDGYHASSLVVDKGSAYSGLIYDLPSKSVFSGFNLSDAPVAGWVSGIVFGSNWNNSHFQHYLVEAGSRWYATRDSSEGKMVNWKTFAFTTDNVASASKWATARTITLTGSVTGSVSIDGSGNVTLATSTNHTHSYMPYRDTRDTDYAPYSSSFTERGLSTSHLKYNTTDGLDDGGTYHSSIFVFPWSDTSGGHCHNIAFTDNGRMWMRHGTSSWSSWSKVAFTTDTPANAVTSSFLDSVSRMEYGWNGVNYFNASLTAGCTAKANDAPTSDWWHILRFNQTDSRGYYTDLAIPLNNNSLYWKCVRHGSLAATSWVKVLDSLNYNEYAPTKTGTGASGTWGISVTGNAATASKWATARTITLSGSVTGSVSIDGSGNVTLATTTNHTHSYLPLAGGTMAANARIAQESGSLYIGSSSNTGYVYLQDMASQNGTEYWKITQVGVAAFQNCIAETFFGALSGNATTATTASKLGSSSVGSGTQHFYLNAGTATASTSTVGGTAKPMYLSAGTMTAISATVGSTDTPVYLNGGTITACSSSLTDYLPLTGGQVTGDFYVQRTSDNASIWARYYNKTAIRMVASSSATFIQCGNYAFTNNVPMYLSGPSGNDGSTLYLKFSGVVASGGITMYSDVRKKDIISDELLSVKSIADAPLFAFNYKTDEAKRLHTGTSAQYWHGAYGDMFGYKDDEGYYTLEYQNLGVAMGISLAREIMKYESKTDKKIRLMKKKINDLEEANRALDARIKELEERRTA